MDGVNTQLQAHFNVGLNTGLTEAQLKNLISVLRAKVGKKVAENACSIRQSIESQKISVRYIERK